MALSVSSPAFSEGGKIPPEYTCESNDISPQLDWFGIPKETKTLALIVDDPDTPGGVFTHWVIFNIPPNSNGLSKAIPSIPEFPNGTLQGENDFGKTGYGGPCPPPGKAHRYRFSLYALDEKLDLAAGSSKNQVLNATGGHILSQCQLTGTYQR